MESYTREQLIEAFKIYNAIAIDEPEKFTPLSKGSDAATCQVDYVISIIEGNCIDL